MKTYEINITDIAELDILEAARYLTQELYTIESALRLVDEIENTISKLAYMPHYAFVIDERLRNLGYRKVNVRNYIVFFCIDEEHNVVNIERVLHGRQNWLKIL